MNPLKKGFLVFILLVVASVAFWFGYGQKVKREEPIPEAYTLIKKFETEGVPDFVGFTTKSEAVKLSSYKGKVIVLSFWATWCAPCIEEFPTMLKMLKKFPDDVVMVGVSADQKPKQVDEFIALHKDRDAKNLVSLVDSTLEIADKYGTEKIPENYIIGRDFKLKRKVSNALDWSGEEVTALLQGIIKEEPK